MSDANAAVIRRFVEEVINNGNYSAMQQLIHEDYVYRSPEQELHGSAALEELLSTYRSGLPDLKTSIDHLVASGNTVVISITLTGTHTGELLGMPATGKRLKAHGMVRSRLEEGKIIEEWELLDMLGMLQQLGVVSMPSPAGAKDSE